MKFKHFLVALCCLGSFISASAQTKLVMVVEGQKQGKFKPDGTEFGSKFADKLEVNAYSMEVSSARDAATGTATGRRMYQPIVIYKLTAGSSPQFVKALTENEVLTKVTIEYYKQSELGTLALNYTVLLENARITGYRQFFGPLHSDSFDGTDSNMYDEIKIVFEKITVTSEKTKTTTTDDWKKVN